MLDAVDGGREEAEGLQQGCWLERRALEFELQNLLVQESDSRKVKMTLIFSLPASYPLSPCSVSVRSPNWTREQLCGVADCLVKIVQEVQSTLLVFRLFL